VLKPAAAGELRCEVVSKALGGDEDRQGSKQIVEGRWQETAPLTVSARRRFYAMGLGEETIFVEVQEICWIDDVNVGNFMEIQVAEVLLVPCN
jgi:hypothetical protein